MKNKLHDMPIYMDYSSTTPVDPRVAEKMIPYITEDFGNPASRSHPYGWTAEKAVEDAKKCILIRVKTIRETKYSMVPNNRAAHLFFFSEFVPPTRLIWHYITVHKNTYTLINFQGFER